MVGAREAAGQLEPAGGDQRAEPLERRRDAAALVAGDLLLRDAGARGQRALREPGAAAGLDDLPAGAARPRREGPVVDVMDGPEWAVHITLDKTYSM